MAAGSTAALPHLTGHLCEFTRSGLTELLLDPDRFDDLTSAAARTLLEVSDKAEGPGGGLTPSNLSGQVRKLFDLSGLSRAFRST